jgi:hypothetical protein
VRCVKVTWEHDFADDPVLYLSEFGGDGYETRKVQFYRDGRSEWADESHETANVGLSEIPFPSLEEISSQSPGRLTAAPRGRENLGAGPPATPSASWDLSP